MADFSYLQKKPQIAARAFVHSNAVIIGDVRVGEDSSIWPFVCARGDMHTIKIGERTSIQDGCILHVTHKGKYTQEGFGVSIGDDVTVGHRVILHGCTIHSFSLIGMGSTLLDGVVVESDVLLGAGSLVLPGKTLTGGYLWAGSPAQKKRLLTDEEKAFIRYSAENYVKLKDQYIRHSCLNPPSFDI